MATSRAKGGGGFRAIVEAALDQVPAGRVTTYGDLARALGEVRAARAIGEILSTNPSPTQAPCHRVVLVDGRLGGYAHGGPQAKARRLRREGVQVRAGRVEHLERFAVRSFQVPDVFGSFARRQRQMARRVRTDAVDRMPIVAIGVDASYSGADGPAFGAACAVDIETGKLLAHAVEPFEPPVPYVPGYLAFRELPGITAAVGKLPAAARRRAILFVDGQGILHPRRCGIASMAGLELKLPAVGVAKRRLVGQAGRRPTRFGAFVGRPILVEAKVRGVELAPAVPGTKPRMLCVSPGTGLSTTQAATLVARLTRPGDESAGPIVLADRLSREARTKHGAF